MLTLSKSIKTKGPICQMVGNALEILESLNKSEIGPREGGKLITCTSVSHGQTSCKDLIPTFNIFINLTQDYDNHFTI